MKGFYRIVTLEMSSKYILYSWHQQLTNIQRLMFSEPKYRLRLER